MENVKNIPQAFERHKDLTDSILYGAHNWKMQGVESWSNHLHQINKLCELNAELVKACKMAFDNMRNGESKTKYRFITVINALQEAITKAEQQ